MMVFCAVTKQCHCTGLISSTLTAKVEHLSCDDCHVHVQCACGQASNLLHCCSLVQALSLEVWKGRTLLAVRELQQVV